MTDRERVLEALRAAGPAGLHSMAARRRGLSGNVSQRISELREMGYRIESEPAPWTDASGKQRHGCIYRISDPGTGPGSETEPAPSTVPLSPDKGRSLAAGSGVEAPSLFVLDPLDPITGDLYRDPDSEAA